MDREYILEEIRRTAAANGGAALGRREFQTATGIAAGDWQGRYWARWGDAVREAGLAPRKLNQAFDERHLLSCLADLALELGRLPVRNEIKLKRHQDPSFPSHNTFARLGNRTETATKLRDYCAAQPDQRYRAVADLCSSVLAAGAATEPEARPQQAAVILGSVYLLKSGKHYKLGRSNAVGRRERELAIQLPTPSQVIHEIKTDDPVGIERYWHLRFESKHLNGEWFALTAKDVADFKRRRFM